VLIRATARRFLNLQNLEKGGLVQLFDDRETICIGNLPIDPKARQLLERLECELQIDHDYVAHATLRSLGRQETTQIEFHQLEFGLALPRPPGPDSDLDADNNGSNGTELSPSEGKSLNASSATLKTNITVRSNLAPNDANWRIDLVDWQAVPGDLIEKWRTDFLGPRPDEMSEMQFAERNYYLPCSRCGRTLYMIRTEGPNEVCWQYRCSETQKL
jgi:molecular chaperone DnaK